MRIITTVLLAITITTLAWAQPSNDECIDAIELTDVQNWCSEAGAYTNVDATVSPQANPTCFPNTQPNNDVWFSFLALSNTVNVSVTGNVPGNLGGTLDSPQVAIYDGDCTGLIDVGCSSDAVGNDQVSLFAGPLTIGQVYYIRVSARFGNTGTFKLCVNNFNEIPAPDGDCEPGVILCDKSPFSVAYLNGVGDDGGEIGDVSCNTGGCDIEESGSTWYKWTCDDPGSLTFSITPANPTDDIDFVLYELPNGIDDCSGKFDLRCMASGENVGSPNANWVNCTGATGLAFGDPDISETCGCQPGNNNFLAPITMVEGRSYALVINNFSQSGSGFSIEFGGTGTFLGPTLGLEMNPLEVCVGAPVQFTDASTFIGNIIGWAWDFGPNATPRFRSGPGPHDISFDYAGMHDVVLTVETERGCIVTETLQGAEVICCNDHFVIDAAITDLQCPDINNGAIDLSVSNDYGPYQYQWSNTSSSQDINNLAEGQYVVEITDQANCTTSQEFEVDSPPAFAFDTIVTMPHCDAGTDGAVEIIVSGGTPSYQYNWGSGFTTDNSIDNLSHGDYPVTILDANGCTIEQILPVHELELVLNPAVDAITPPSCTGFSDGSIVLNVINGTPAYLYDWNNGAGFGTNNTLSGIPEGVYEVDILDDQLCEGSYSFTVTDPPPLALDTDVMDVLCYGESNGSISATPSGGVGGYTISWEIGQQGSPITDLPIGTYTVTLTDANGCELIADPMVNQPPPLLLDIVDIINNICFGDEEGQITVEGAGGVPPYEYNINDSGYQLEPVFPNLPAGIFDVNILDANGCITTVEGEVTQPPQLFVNAGPDQFITLGYTTTGQAVPSIPSVTFEWSPLDSLDCLNPPCDRVFFNPTSTTTYEVLITDENGCEAVDQLIIHVIKDREIYIPNAFSPNDDGVNDFFTVFGGPGIRQIKKFQIFSRWGELVYENSNFLPNQQSKGWNGIFNGKKMNNNVFVYVAEVEYIDNEVIIYSGDLTLLRH